MGDAHTWGILMHDDTMWTCKRTRSPTDSNTKPTPNQNPHQIRTTASKLPNLQHTYIYVHKYTHTHIYTHQNDITIPTNSTKRHAYVKKNPYAHMHTHTKSLVGRQTRKPERTSLQFGHNGVILAVNFITKLLLCLQFALSLTCCQLHLWKLFFLQFQSMNTQSNNHRYNRTHSHMHTQKNNHAITYMHRKKIPHMYIHTIESTLHPFQNLESFPHVFHKDHRRLDFFIRFFVAGTWMLWHKTVHFTRDCDIEFHHPPLKLFLHIHCVWKEK